MSNNNLNTFRDQPDEAGRFGIHGGRFVAETLMPLILDVEIENISMLVTQKQENIAIIRKNEGQFAALIDAMIKRSQANN